MRRGQDDENCGAWYFIVGGLICVSRKRGYFAVAAQITDSAHPHVLDLLVVATSPMNRMKGSSKFNSAPASAERFLKAPHRQGLMGLMVILNGYGVQPGPHESTKIVRIRF